MTTNSRYPVIEGDIWAYLSESENSDWIQWRVDRIYDEFVDLSKVTGESAGWKASKYPLEDIRAPDWRWLKGEAKPQVLFSCPLCDKDKPILDGDYCCMDCRESLDKEP